MDKIAKKVRNGKNLLWNLLQAMTPTSVAEQMPKSDASATNQ
jgi:hypothetical protein